MTIADRQGAPAAALQVSATSAGAWGNQLEVVVADGTLDPGDEFRLAVRRGGAVVEAFDNLSIDPDTPNFADNDGQRPLPARADRGRHGET